MTRIVFFAAALFAQAAPDSQNLKPFVLQLKGQSELRHVLVDPDEIHGLSFNVLIDEPWSGEQWEQIQRINVAELVPEESSLRRHWIEKGWSEHGGEQVPMRSGEKMWVLTEDKKWADKSQALARAAYSPGETAIEAVALPEESSRRGPGFMKLWAPHAAVLAAAFALAVGAYLVLLRPRAQWSALDSGNRSPRRR